jgi:hypothetical protein
MESFRSRPDDSLSGRASIPDAASVEREVAKLFEQFRLDLEQMFGGSARTSSPGKTTTVSHLMTRRKGPKR